VNAKNTSKPDSWLNAEIIATGAAGHLLMSVVDFGVWWHLKHRPRPLPVELVEAMRATSFRTFVRGLPRPFHSMTARERAEHRAEHIRRVAPVVVRMLTAFPEDAKVPESLEKVFYTLHVATDAVGYVERCASAHDAAVDELFNPEGHA
jgi:hypothetical protein